MGVCDADLGCLTGREAGKAGRRAAITSGRGGRWMQGRRGQEAQQMVSSKADGAGGGDTPGGAEW
ncbi:hypothetical protein J1614_005399 [Plenodomus biglobosus]|nr:hypothetical protein J1614_005399 [Plenodomus biglobosus]